MVGTPTSDLFSHKNIRLLAKLNQMFGVTSINF
jgi:hypothetical protein